MVVKKKEKKKKTIYILRQSSLNDDDDNRSEFDVHHIHIICTQLTSDNVVLIIS